MQKQVTIIGSGIVGAVTAYYLSSDPTLNVTIYDEGIGQATKNSAGIISPWLSKRRNQRWYNLAKSGAALYPEIVADTQMGYSVYQQAGTIVTRENPDDLQALYDLAVARKQQAPQIGQIEKLTAEQVQDRIPLLTNPQPGVFVSGGARVDGDKFAHNLLKYCEKRNLVRHKGKVALGDQGQLLTPHGQQNYDTLILAVGAWLKPLLLPMKIVADVRPQKGQLIELQLPESWGDDVPVLMPEGERDFIPFTRSKLVVGATHENDMGYDLQVSDLVEADLFASGRKLDANLTKDQITQVKVGTRAYTRDFAPFFGPLPDNPHILVASGLGSSGLTTGPMIGKLLAEYVQTGRHDWDDYALSVDHYLSPAE
ncbi:NAD(P)/FAD-dependent oxidoreductase [Lactiplantibacillus fabifermentans]|uniref:DadA family oxidoreductase n=2 Tax=Lactiplantibacillus fabifermentans TaxID=483011 RepID=A0A0R2NNR9_9LACO|nr:FAD-binding oxidoreductase [Lactiplantibacillus fabifermentans]ETY74324.1 oxidoreductase [Lactiplantibacillus fabifermentans T30PCM01]KRO27020.1 DadA family oxidoreductase [Lactiplantibacillus fabifermentans DSM 21115]